MLQNNAGLGFFMSLAYMSMVSYKRWSWLSSLFRQGWTRHVSTSVIVYGGLYGHKQWCHKPRPLLQTPPAAPRAIVLMIVISLPICQKQISFPHNTRTYHTLGKESVQTRIINSVNHLTGFMLMTPKQNWNTFAFLFGSMELLHWIYICNNDIWQV